MRSGRRLLVAVAAAIASGGLVAGGYLWASHRYDDRRAEVAERGAEVMSFDLERTTHIFKKLEHGGAQTVVADDPDDDAQIAEIRHHLRAETEAFRQGRFDDPAEIHGMEMPGLAALEKGYPRVAIRYEDVSAGGRISYTTDDRDLVDAIHAWFEAQVSDHGRHARGDS